MIDPSRRPAWEDKFFAELKKGQTVRDAMKVAGIGPGTLYRRRAGNAHFAQAWKAIRTWNKPCGDPASAMSAAQPSADAAPAADGPRRSNWRAIFFDALAETSNLTAAAARANVTSRTIYALRREDRDFAARWLAALGEGYDNLEMELVGYLRDPQPRRKMDVTAALRLLAAHRETVERRRALTAQDDEKATLESLDAFFEGLRQRRLANEAVLREGAPGDGAE
jgi:hypothetical protein